MVLETLKAVFWGPWWAPEHAALHFSMCEEVDILKPYWMELISNFIKILATLALFGPPTDAASAATTLSSDMRDLTQKGGAKDKLKAAGKGSFLAMALGTCTADCLETWKLLQREGGTTWWMQYQCSAIVWITSPNFCSACAAFALWYLAHVRLNLTNSLPYARYGWNLYKKGEDGDLSEKAYEAVNLSGCWFCTNFAGWRYSLTKVIWRQGPTQAVYIAFLTMFYILPLTLMLPHLLLGYVASAFPSTLLCLGVKELARCLTRRYIHWKKSDYTPLAIEPNITAKELYDTLHEKDIELKDVAINERVRNDWISEGLDAEALRSLSDAELRLFLAQIRYPFLRHADILNVTRSFRNSRELVVKEYAEYISRRGTPCPQENLQALLEEDKGSVAQNGAPDLAWETYFFFCSRGKCIGSSHVSDRSTLHSWRWIGSSLLEYSHGEKNIEILELH